VTTQNQADTDIHEDQLRTVLVTTLTGAFGISIAGTADIDPEDISEGLVGATADGTSMWRRRAGADVAAGGGRSRNSFAWVLLQHGLRCR
jgi:hypothetical protein